MFDKRGVIYLTSKRVFESSVQLRQNYIAPLSIFF